MSPLAWDDWNETNLGPLAMDFPMLWTASTFVEMVASTDGREKMIDAIPDETREHQRYR